MRLLLISIISVLLMSSSLISDDDSKAKKMLKEALYLEVGLGQREKAFHAYEKILKSKDLPKETRALALLRKGIILDSYGKRESAIECYKTIIHHYSKMERIVREARQRLERGHHKVDPRERLEQEIKKLKKHRNDLIRHHKDDAADEVDNEMVKLKHKLHELNRHGDKHRIKENIEKLEKLLQHPDVKKNNEKKEHIKNEIKHLGIRLHSIEENERTKEMKEPHSRRPKPYRQNHERGDRGRPRYDQQAKIKDVKLQVKLLKKLLKELEKGLKKAEKKDHDELIETLEKKIDQMEEKKDHLEEWLEEQEEEEENNKRRRNIIRK
ncbi:MAG: hypothetical protein COA79_09895 [Planctomycetota bacterium]|nr:MAG: hypothetical protein COA79_09895 [Planctomycetota bacterium]